MPRTRKSVPESAKNTEFAKRFEQALTEAGPGLSDAVWAKKFGTTGEAVRTWRSGEGIPSGKNLIKICTILECSADWLLLGRQNIKLGKDDEPADDRERHYAKEVQHKDEVIVSLREQIELYKKHQSFLEAQLQQELDSEEKKFDSLPGLKKK